MKKKIFAVAMATVLLFGMTACGKEDENNDDQHAGLTTAAEVTEEKNTTEEASTEDNATAADTQDVNSADGTIVLGNVISFSLEGTDYAEYSVNGTTNVYAENNNLQTFAISGVDCGGMSAADVVAQFKAQIESVYGTNYTTYDTTFNGLTYTTYDFGTNNSMSDAINVTCYVYVENNVCIYVEEAWATTLPSSSGDTEKVMQTITIL